MTLLSTIELKDFDRGIFSSLGASLQDYVVDGSTRKAYSIAVPGVTTNIPQFSPKVPVYWSKPEDVFQDFKLPCYVVLRTGLTPAFDRAPWQASQRAPASDAIKVSIPSTKNPGQTVDGFDKYDYKNGATPFNIGYDLQVMARTQNVGVMMLKRALQACVPPYFTVEAYDSLGDRRLYDAGEVSVSSTGELADVADRTASWTISFEVRGELDLYGIGEQTDIIEEFPLVPAEAK